MLLMKAPSIFIGAVLAIEAYPQFQSIGLAPRIGAVISISVVKQIGPVLTAVMLAGRVGGALTAELGTMKVTEQIDAMEASAVEPLRYLVATRVMACILMLPLLTLCADFCAILTGWIAETVVDPVTLRHFVNSALKGVQFSDFIPPTLKTL